MRVHLRLNAGRAMTLWVIAKNAMSPRSIATAAAVLPAGRCHGMKPLRKPAK